MAAFGRAMAEKKMVEQAGMNSFSDRGGGRRDKAVNHDRNFEARRRRGIRRPSRRSRNRRAPRASTRPRRSAARWSSSARVTTSILRRTPASSRPVPRPTIDSGEHAGERGQECGGGRAVRDAHLADADQRRAAIGEIAGDFDSDFECARGLVGRHRGTVEEIAGARADAAIRHAIERLGTGVDFHADIDDFQRIAEAAREHADRGAAARRCCEASRR